MLHRALAVALLCACTAAIACSSAHAPLPLASTTDDAGTPSGTTDAATSADGSLDDAATDGTAGPLGTKGNPGTSCKAILDARPGVPSGTYVLLAGTKAFDDYCDMTTAGGGWTRVKGAPASDPTSDPKIVDALRGPTGKLLLKCAEADLAPYIMSPSFDTGWAWGASTPTFKGGTWSANGVGAACDAVLTLPAGDCSTWWGISCASTSGNKVLAGVTASTTALTCTSASAVNTGGAFNVCGSATYADYVAFVRGD